jgi:hypothetical protein
LQTCNVAAIAFANGNDNISVYAPLANSELDSLLVMLSVFFTKKGRGQEAEGNFDSCLLQGVGRMVLGQS